MDNSLNVDNLIAGARKFAELAMAARARPDHELFALQAGVAVERLTKAALASRNPVLLLEMRGSVEMLFHLTGLRSADKIRTIGMTEAVARLRRLDVLPREDPKLDLLIELRNGVAHSRVGGITEDLLPTMATTIDVLLSDVGEDRESFWGSWLEAIAMVREEARDRLTRDVQLRILHARHLYEARVSAMPTKALDGYLRSMPFVASWCCGSNANGIFYTRGVDCPACANRVAVPLTVPREQDAADNERELVAMDALVCDYCQLALVSWDELRAAGIEPFIYADACGDPELVLSARNYILGLRGLRMGGVQRTRAVRGVGTIYRSLVGGDTRQHLSGRWEGAIGGQDGANGSVGVERQHADLDDGPGV